MCLHKYFQEDLYMILIVFVGSNTPFGLPLTRISCHKDPCSKKAPLFEKTAAFLAIFNPFLTYKGLNINFQSTPVLLTKFSENVFLALKVPQSKYHLLWTSRSKKKINFKGRYSEEPFSKNILYMFTQFGQQVLTKGVVWNLKIIFWD